MQQEFLHKLKLTLMVISVAINAVFLSVGIYLAMSLKTNGDQVKMERNGVGPTVPYQMDAQLSIQAVNLLIKQSLQDGPSIGTKATHLSNLTLQFDQRDLVTDAKVFIFGKTLNLSVTSTPVVFNGDVRLDVTSARVSGYNLPVSTLFTILHAIDLPSWLTADARQNQIWLHLTGHPFGSFVVSVRSIHPIADQIQVQLTIVNKK